MATACRFVSLRDKQATALNSEFEDATWTVFQTHRETSRLVENIVLAQNNDAPNSVTVST